LIDGTDMRDIDLPSYYANIGMIFQEPMWHEARVREQIGYGDLAALDNMARIRHAAQLGGAEAFIDKLPGGSKPTWGCGSWKSTPRSSRAASDSASRSHAP
jgi:ABC-type multidrug transport system fused ATPase/permease subunit